MESIPETTYFYKQLINARNSIKKGLLNTAEQHYERAIKEISWLSIYFSEQEKHHYRDQALQLLHTVCAEFGSHSNDAQPFIDEILLSTVVSVSQVEQFNSVLSTDFYDVTLLRNNGRIRVPSR